MLRKLACYGFGEHRIKVSMDVCEFAATEEFGNVYTHANSVGSKFRMVGSNSTISKDAQGRVAKR